MLNVDFVSEGTIVTLYIFSTFLKEVIGITLSNFYYKFTNDTILWGSTLCISNKLLKEKGTFSFK